MATVVVMQEIRPLENRRGSCVPTWALLCSFARDTKEAGKQWDESLCRIGEDFKTQSDMLARLWPKLELKRGHSTLPSAPASLHHPSSWQIIFQEVFPYSCFPELVNQKSARNFARPGVLESCLLCISLTTPGSEPPLPWEREQNCAHCLLQLCPGTSGPGLLSPRVKLTA